MTGRTSRPFPAPWRSRYVAVAFEASVAPRAFLIAPAQGRPWSLLTGRMAVLQTEKAFQKQLGVNIG